MIRDRARPGPQQLRGCVVSRAYSMRLYAYVQRVGLNVAAKSLGVGIVTLQNGMDEGSMLPGTRDRLFAALDREERGEAIAS